MISLYKVICLTNALSELELSQNTSGKHDCGVHPFLKLILTTKCYTDS